MPHVEIVVGSDSDLPIVKVTVDVLEEFDVSYELTIASAHRTPKRAMELATTAEERGVDVIIAAAWRCRASARNNGRPYNRPRDRVADPERRHGRAGCPLQYGTDAVGRARSHGRH